MARLTSPALRLVTDEAPTHEPPAAGRARLEALTSALAAATGWSIDFVGDSTAFSALPTADAAASVAVVGAAGDRWGQLLLRGGCVPTPPEPATAAKLAAALAGLVGELFSVEQALVEREAELAAHLAVSPRPDEDRRLAAVLEATLASVVRHLGCRAAGLYLLDDATTELKLRAAHGLPRSRLARPARPLAVAKADLEALLGHAVVLESTESYRRWNLPENFPSAVCLPVASGTSVLGTLWLFDTAPRPFADADVNVAEIAAGRLAAELERHVLLGEAAALAGWVRERAELASLRETLEPRIAPLAPGWEIAGPDGAAPRDDADLVDWFARPDGTLFGLVARAEGQGGAAALRAQMARTALRAHAAHVDDPGRLVRAVHETLWSAATAGLPTDLACCVAAPDSGRVRLAAAGQFAVRLARGGKPEVVGECRPPLGQGLDGFAPWTRSLMLSAGDTLWLGAGPAAQAASLSALGGCMAPTTVAAKRRAASKPRRAARASGRSPASTRRRAAATQPFPGPVACGLTLRRRPG